MSIVNSGTKSLSSFLKDDCYYIPEYQRGYSWEENQLEDLWLDLTQLYEEEVTSHFFGQVVIHNDNVTDRKYIIDGQQRTSTAIILLDSFRFAFKNYFEKEKSDAKYEIEEITTIYIGRMSDKRFEPRLFLSDNNRLFFAETIQKEQSVNLPTDRLLKLSKSEILIYKASKYFEKRIYEFMMQFTDFDAQYMNLKKLLKIFLDNFIFMTIETKEINQAFIIFETLNARGKELAIADLLKNHVFRTAGKEIEDAKVSWDTVIDTLDGIDPTKFIRHYWNAQYRFIRERDLYMAIRRKIGTPAQVASLMHDLVRLSELYASLYRPNKTTYFKNHDLIEQNREINNLGARSYYPIIMALVIKGFSEDDIFDIHNVIETFIVRNFTVSGKTANRSEKNFAEIAQKIAQGELSTASTITDSINSLIISDEEFYENFKIFEVKKSNIIRYLLRKIHNHRNVETRIISDNNAVHIEHIMPKNIKHANDWKVDAEQHEAYLNRFGNLTLLGQEYNQSAVNKGFEHKRFIYRLSKIPMTIELTNYSSWSTKDIENRQKQLATIAVEIWKK